MMPNRSGVVVVFDGHDLTSRFLITDIQRPKPTFEATMSDNPAGGSFLMGVRRGAGEISLSLHVKGGSKDRQNAIRELTSWLNVDGVREMSFSDDMGLTYLAVPNGSTDAQSLYFREIITVKFAVPYPYMLGETRTATVPSGGSVQASVGGTLPALPVINTTTAVRSNSTNLWGLQVDGGDYVHIPVPVSTASTIAIDCMERTSTVNNASTLITLDSDWLSLAPGIHTISNDQGTGASTLTWRELWAI